MRAVAVVGAGPAGLMAAEVLANAGVVVTVYDANPRAGRKFLLAGRSGLNLTHAEPLPAFVARYGAEASRFARFLATFSPSDLRAWADSLGAETYVGSSGRVFPRLFKGATLLSAWLDRLHSLRVRIRGKHRLVDLGPGPELAFAGPDGVVTISPRAAILTLGGSSWASTGSDGRWAETLAQRGVDLAPFKPANCGFEVDWSTAMRAQAGEPLKTLALRMDAGGEPVRGELMVTKHGLEGGALYALAAGLRDRIERDGHAILRVDLKPDLDAKVLASRLKNLTPASAVHRLRLTPTARTLVWECSDEAEREDPQRFAALIKGVPVRLERPRPLDEAISTAGGVRFSACDDHLMLRALPEVFCAGEMLDWEAPTGGYLLQGCLSTAVQAANGVLARLGLPPSSPTVAGPQPAPVPGR